MIWLLASAVAAWAVLAAIAAPLTRRLAARAAGGTGAATAHGLAAGVEMLAAIALWICLGVAVMSGGVAALSAWSPRAVSEAAMLLAMVDGMAGALQTPEASWAALASLGGLALGLFWAVRTVRRAHLDPAAETTQLIDERLARRLRAAPETAVELIEPELAAQRLGRVLARRQWALSQIERRVDGADFLIIAAPEGRAAALRAEMAELDALITTIQASQAADPPPAAAQTARAAQSMGPDQPQDALQTPSSRSPPPVHSADVDRRRRRARRRRATGRAIASLFASAEALGAMSAPLRAVVFLAAALGAPASLLISGPPAAEALRQLALTRAEDLRRLELAAAQITARSELAALAATSAPLKVQSASIAAPRSDPDESIAIETNSVATKAVAPAPDDALVADALARIFEADAAPAGWLPPAPTVADPAAATQRRLAFTLAWRADRVRDALIRRRGARARAVDAAAEPATRPAAPAQDLFEASLETRGPVTAVGRYAADAYRDLARTQPSLWARLVARRAALSEGLGREASPQHAPGLAVSRRLGREMTRGADGAAPSDAQRFVEAAFAAFTAELVRSGDLAAARSRSAALAPLATDHTAARALARLGRDAGAAEGFVTAARAAAPRLLDAPGDGLDQSGARAAMTRLAAPYEDIGPRPDFGAAPIPRAPLALSDPLARFADYFPARLGDERASPRAEMARALGLIGAPSAPGAWRVSVAEAARSERAAARARSYDALRGFHRVGGVLLGRPPEPGGGGPVSSLDVTGFSWRMQDGAVTVTLKTAAGRAVTLGPVAAATAQAALAYAADGRPIAVTMVTATPLADLKILTHPALLDTPIGCHARRLDQFADLASAAASPLSQRRAEIETAARAELALYRLAWARRVAAFADVVLASDGEASVLRGRVIPGPDGALLYVAPPAATPGAGSGLGPDLGVGADLGPDLGVGAGARRAAAFRTLKSALSEARLEAFGAIVDQAAEALFDGALATQADRALGAPAALDLETKPAHFDPELVDAIFACRGAETVQAFLDCVGPRVSESAAFEAWRRPGLTDGPARRDMGQLRWLAPPPDVDFWTGVRERPYALDPDLAFLAPDPASAEGSAGRVWPFDFVLQLVPRSPAYFADPFLAWWSPENVAIEAYIDRSPWVFDAFSAALTAEISRRSADRAAGTEAASLSAMRDFAVLQRLFRAALDQRFGPSFPIEALLELDAALETALPPDIGATPTQRWNLRDGVAEIGLLRVLRAANAAPPELGAGGGWAAAADRCLAFAGARAGADALSQALAQGDGLAALAQIAPAAWDAVCGPARFAPRREIAALAEQVSAGRALRDALGLDADRRLSRRLERQGCPAP